MNKYKEKQREDQRKKLLQSGIQEDVIGKAKECLGLRIMINLILLAVFKMNKQKTGIVNELDGKRTEGTLRFLA